ncbi:MAG: pyruvate carboxylase subunit B [Candidatus Latescibacteria bacterium]|nr:pyruvate carboxylase subunit B [Candidatus Latescibacterota bacterium]
MKPVKIIDTTFRDAHQSLMATRMRVSDMLPICEQMDRIGFFAMEVWGGATFDVCIRYLAEDPWQRLNLLREHLPNTKLLMLVRGQNIVGYRHYADDVVKEFIKLARKHGIDIFRVFDALNDIRNMEKAIKIAKDIGAEVQGAISYTTSPVHTIEKFVEFAIELEEMGCDYICIKDMAGLISPQASYALVKALKQAVKIPIDLHTHCTSGMGPISYYSAVQADVDIIDTAISIFAGGSSQPALENLVVSLKDTPYDTKLNLQKIIDVGYHFLQMKQKYAKYISPIAEMTDASVAVHQIPGGMLSNLHAQLKEQNALDKYQQVLEETPRVREDLGYPPLVTPTSQIVGIQAVMNVLAGKRYTQISKEVKDYCLGLYGKPPAPIKPDILKMIIGDEKPMTRRPADLLKPELAARKIEAEKLGILRKGTEQEDLVTYTLFPQIAVKFLKGECKAEKIEPLITTEELHDNLEEQKIAAIAVALNEHLTDNGKFIQISKTTDKQVSGWKIKARQENIQ